MSTPSYPTSPQPGFFVPPPPPPSGYGYSYPYASLLARFGAVLLDFFILLAAACVIAIPFGIFAIAAIAAGTPIWWLSTFVWGPFALIMFALWIAYFTYFESTTGQTLGKKALGLRVVSTSTGRPPDLAHSLVRNILRIVDWLPFLFLLGFLIALITPNKQRLGDVVADTMVLRA